MRIHSKYLLLTLGIGWFLGAASGLLFMRLCPPGRHPGRMRARFERQLKLTPDQKAKVDAIFQAGRQQMDQIYAEIRPRLEALRDSTSVQIRQLLTPEQQLKFDKLEAKRRQHFEERFGHPPSTPPEPEH